MQDLYARLFKRYRLVDHEARPDGPEGDVCPRGSCTDTKIELITP